MSAPRPARAAAVATLLAMAVTPVAAQEFTLRGERVAIYNLAGTARVEPGTGPDVTVRMSARGADAGTLEAKVIEARGRPALVVRYPDSRIRYRGDGDWRGETTVIIRKDGTFGDQGGTWRGERVTISSSRGLDASADLVVQVPTGKRVELFVGAGRLSASDIEGALLLDLATGSVRADRIRGVLMVDTGSGEVTVSSVTGDVNIDTGSGDVTLGDIKASDLLVDTGSGSVTGATLSAAKLRVDTGSGSVRLREVVCADIGVDTGSGSVELGLLSLVRNLDVDTGSGSVTVVTRAGMQGMLDLSTGSGRVEMPYPLEIEVKTPSELKGKLGDGNGTIRVDSGSGNITFRKS